MTTFKPFTEELAEVKLRELLIYLCERRITARSFGTSQLNTLLCLSDFLHFRRHGESITGADYVVAEHGPWLVKFELYLDPLLDDGSIVIQPSDLGGYTQYRPMALASADLFGFNGAEIATAEQVLRATEDQSASELGDLAHSLTRWRNGDLGDPLPYELALDGQSA
ncbi:MAG: Panacea domain-containing protein [Chloroflexota bacterium]|nr:Panacea domain-containing protein [Chloroflexota bacterium]